MQSQQPRMTLEQARATMWLRNHHRPMGELLDEGYLDQGRLAWAVQWAYNSQIKEAAVVLLDWLRRAPSPQPKPAAPPSAVNAGISIEQARTTVWPFKPFKGQFMGELLDTRQIGPEKLGHAIEHAWDDRVRRAAMALLAVSLHQVVEEPPPSAGPVKVVSSGRSYSEQQQLKLTLWAGIIMGVLLGPALLLLINGMLQGATSNPNAGLSRTKLGEIASTPEGIVVLVIVVLILLIFLIGGILVVNLFSSLIYRQFERRLETYRQGQEGETRVVETLCSVLDGHWTLFRNVILPGYKADLDLVLVGPAGVWVLEVKTLTGAYRNAGEQWEFRAGKRWNPLKKSPSRQARNNAARLGGFLQADKVKQWVDAAVVWANPESALTVDNPMVAVWTLDRLPDELGNLWQDRKVDEGTQARIVDKLARLCKKKERR